MEFSSDPARAEQEMHAVILYLTTFGYIDGHFDETEKAFVLAYIDELAHKMVESTHGAEPGREQAAALHVERLRAHFTEVEHHVRGLLDEPVSEGESSRAFAIARLKTRCFEIFQSFDRVAQEALLDVGGDLLMVDGVAQFAELEFHAELSKLLDENLVADLPLTPREVRMSRVIVDPPRVETAPTPDHPLFADTERPFETRGGMVDLERDLELVSKGRALFAQQRGSGAGRLAGKGSVRDLAGTDPFLDGHVYAFMPAPAERHELLVIGDLHGCYSVLKAALVQSRFLEKVEAWRSAPLASPRPLLVLLGDYIDRGLFSLNGVLRAVLSVFVAAPEHVVMLRGNHEEFVEHEGEMTSGVCPSEAIDSLRPYASLETLRAFRDFFEELPSVLLFDEIVFVHGGIASDRRLKERFRDLSSLNDRDIRYEMMWSDPSAANIIPPELQDQTVRFAFGKRQAWAFLQSIGCTTLIRGHGRVESGFARHFDDPDLKLYTLFSAGGQSNRDLPDDSGYRDGVPMVLTLSWQNGVSTISPWTPNYEAYNTPKQNGFLRSDVR